MDSHPDDELAPDVRARRFAGNALWMISGEAAGKIASFVFVVIVARGLGPTAYGYFNFAVSFVPLFLMMAAWGLNVALVREVARDRENMPELFVSAVVIRLGLGVVALLIALSLAPFLVASNEALATVAIVGLALLLDELAALIGSVFKAYEAMRYDAIVSMINRLASTALAFLVLASGAGLLVVSFTYLLGSLGAAIFGLLVMRKRFPPFRMSDASRARIRFLFAKGLPLGVAAVLNTMLLRIDTVMLQAIEGPIAVAMYGVAYRFFESFLFVGWALPSVIMPNISRAGPGEESGRLVQLTTVANLAFYLPLAAGAPFAAEAVVSTVFSSDFGAAADAVPWVSAAAVFYALAHLGRHASIALGSGREIAFIAGGALALNVTLNLILIPSHSFEGAAIATLISEIVEAGALMVLFARRNRGFPSGSVLAVPLVAAAMMVATLVLSGVRGWMAVWVGALSYISVLAAATRLMAPEEGRRVLSLLRRRER